MRLEISQQQKQIISPVVMQKLELLTIPAVELAEKLEEEAEINPVIELEYRRVSNEDDSAKGNADEETETNFQDSSDVGLVDRTRKKDRISRDYNSKIYIENFSRDEPNLAEYILEQTHFQNFTEREKELTELIVTSLDDRGFLTQSIPNLIEGTAYSLKEFEKIRRKVMALDPLGIGSTSIKEFLMFQIESELGKNSLEYRILDECSDLLEKKQFTRIAQRLNTKQHHAKATYKQVEEAVNHIKVFNIIPLSNFSTGDIKYIIPDAIVEVREEQIDITLVDDYIPNVRINDNYARLSQETTDKSIKSFLKENIEKAQMLIENLRSRKEILFKVILKIIEKQKDYFLKGDQYQIPLKLKDIADELNIHESTVSRAIKEKYIQTDKGIISLKGFFSTNVGNEDTSSNSVKEILKNIVDAEDKNDPLTDDKIVRILKNKGISISRRTVAKYRGTQKIPPAYLRRNPV